MLGREEVEERLYLRSETHKRVHRVDARERDHLPYFASDGILSTMLRLFCNKQHHPVPSRPDI
jgi:hypothetical protein